MRTRTLVNYMCVYDDDDGFRFLAGSVPAPISKQWQPKRLQGLLF